MPAILDHLLSRPFARRRTGQATLLATCIPLLAHLAPSGASAFRSRIMRAADFVDSIGVNTHIGADPYNDPEKIAGMLSYLGVANVRQTSPTDAAALENMRVLGRSGARLDLVVNGGGPVNLAGALEGLRDLAPFLNVVECVNEAMIWPILYDGHSGVEAVVALQKDLYTAVKADPALSHLPVLIFTLGGVDPGAFPEIGDLSDFADFGNIHSYPTDGMRPCFVLHAAIEGGRTSAARQPVMITETGYYTLPYHRDWGGVTEDLQARYLLGLLLDEAAAGVARTYIYDLIDDGPDPERNNREHNFGLFRYDGSPKPAATAIRNLIAVLADSSDVRHRIDAPAFPFTANGVPYDHTGNTMLLQKSDGTQIVVVWNEEQSWDPRAGVSLAIRSLPVTVMLPDRCAIIEIVDPMVGTAPVQTLRDTSQVELNLTDHPLLLIIPPPVGRRAATIPYLMEKPTAAGAQYG